MGEYGTVMHEENDPDFLLQENFLEKKKSGQTKLAYKELFQDEKTEWMGWEKYIITQMTDTKNHQLDTSNLGQVLTKLLAWKTLTYSIVGEYRVFELIMDKIQKLSVELNISEDLAQAVLLKSSWDD